MKILHVSIGGMILRSYFSGQLRYLKDKGYDIVVAAEGGKHLEQLAREEECGHHAIDIVRPISLRKDLHALIQLCRVIRSEKPDVVQCHTPKGALLGMIAALVCRVPVRIYHLRAMPVTTATGLTRHILTFTEFISSRIATHFLSISPSLADDYAKWSKFDRNDIYIPGQGSGNGVDAEGRFDRDKLSEGKVRAFREKYKIPADARTLVFIGRLTPEKGILELFNAWRTLREQYHDIYLIICGPIDARVPLDASVIKNLEGDSRVVITAFVAAPEELLASTYLLTVPSHREGFGNVYAEAAAMKVPAVAYRVTGVIDAIENNKTGLLVPLKDTPALTAAISRYLDDETMRNEHAEEARTRITHLFSRKIVWQAIDEFYCTLPR